MHHVLYVAGVLFGTFGLAAFLAANGAVQQAVGGALMMIGAVFFSGGAVVDALRLLRKELRQQNSAIYGSLKKLVSEVTPKP